jgi:hypothetical protein
VDTKSEKKGAGAKVAQIFCSACLLRHGCDGELRVKDAGPCERLHFVATMVVGIREELFIPLSILDLSTAQGLCRSQLLVRTFDKSSDKLIRLRFIKSVSNVGCRDQDVFARRRQYRMYAKVVAACAAIFDVQYASLMLSQK